MKRIYLILTLLLTSSIVFAGPVDSSNIYNASVIREELKKNANTVRRLYTQEISISGPDRAIVKTREVITILNSKGAGELLYYNFTDKFRSLEDVDLKLYDADGNLIEKHKKKDLTSQSAGSGLVEDGKVFFIRLASTKYPVTIEKEYVVKHNGIYQLPTFYFCEPYQSVETAKLTLKYPSSMTVNHKRYHLATEGKKTVDGKDEIWQWEVHGLASLVHEKHAGDWKYQVPRIGFNLSKFEYDGYAGDMSSWRNLGLWYNYLVGTTNRLSPRFQEEIRQMVSGAKSDREKIKILYENLQKNFRYVSIQLGIGGLKPFSADFVHEKKYGDCKGLSNYMEACLAAVGIKSYNAWIKSGDDEIMMDPDFPHHVFDHQILMVPQPHDSIWLECTSNYNDFNHLGSFTENRYALVMTEQGGVLVKTPTGNPISNSLDSRSIVKLNNEGNTESETQFTSKGEFKYLMINLSRASSDDQKTYFINFFGMQQPDEFTISYPAGSDTSYVVKTALVMEKGYDFKTGAKFFLKPRLFRNWTTKFEEEDKRSYDYFIDYPFLKSDTTIYIIPEDMSVESLPKNKMLTFKYGSYEASYIFDQATRQITSMACLKVTTQRFPASEYSEVKKFFDQVLNDGNQKIILVSRN